MLNHRHVIMMPLRRKREYSAKAQMDEVKQIVKVFKIFVIYFLFIFFFLLHCFILKIVEHQKYAVLFSSCYFIFFFTFIVWQLYDLSQIAIKNNLRVDLIKYNELCLLLFIVLFYVYTKYNKTTRSWIPSQWVSFIFIFVEKKKTCYV